MFRMPFAVAALCLSTGVMAAPKYSVYPVQVGSETVRFQQGVPTVDLQLSNGAVQITPLNIDHGSFSFGIAVWNNSETPTNFGVENIQVESAGSAVGVFTKDQLVAKAENRAMWSQIGLAALGGLAAAAAASNQNNYMTTTLRTPRGIYTAHTTYHDSAADLRAAASIAAAGVGIAAVQRRLDETRAALGDQIVQTSTVDPFESYGGRIIIHKLKALVAPQDIKLSINWNGEVYPLTFRVQKFASPPPVFNAITQARMAERAANASAASAIPVAPAASAPVAMPVAPAAAAPLTTVATPAIIAPVTPAAQMVPVSAGAPKGN